MLTAGQFFSAVSLLSWTAKSEVISISTSKQKFCYSEVGRKLGGVEGSKKKKELHNEMQSLCSENQDEQILTSHAINGRIGMNNEVSNEI